MVSFMVFFYFVALFSGVLMAPMDETMCPYSDGPTYDNCSMNTLKAVWPSLLKGNPAIGKVPLDPLHIPIMQQNQSGLYGLIEGISTYTNINITGLRTLTFDYYKSDLANLGAQLIVSVQWIKIETFFNFTISTGGIPHQVHGRFSGKFENLTLNQVGSIKRVKVNDVDYFQLNTLSVNTTIKSGHIKIHMDNVIYQGTAQTLAGTFNLSPGFYLNRFKSKINQVVTEAEAQVLKQGLTLLTADQWLPGAPTS